MPIPPPPVVLAHLAAAIGALVVGMIQLLRPKGTPGHRALGWTWAALMFTVAITSLWIPAFLHFSWIHIFTLVTLIALPVGLWRAHQHNVTGHARTMRRLYIGGLIVAGVFTLVPGRLLGNLVWHHAWGYLPSP
ncbi:MAG: DUF2306 domain-containing protein [Proteobacteria bacterium]|nr:DUF2306 domain-containing protein [Pseudomonadota bacterium]